MTDLVLCVLLWWGVGTAMHGQFHFFFLAKGPQLLSLSVAPRMKITAWNISHHHRIACGHAERTTLGRPHECEVMRSNVLQQGPLQLQDGPDLIFSPFHAQEAPTDNTSHAALARAHRVGRPHVIYGYVARPLLGPCELSAPLLWAIPDKLGSSAQNKQIHGPLPIGTRMGCH